MKEPPDTSWIQTTEIHEGRKPNKPKLMNTEHKEYVEAEAELIRAASDRHLCSQVRCGLGNESQAIFRLEKAAQRMVRAIDAYNGGAK